MKHSWHYNGKTVDALFAQPLVSGRNPEIETAPEFCM
jgi:hypothetical protein